MSSKKVANISLNESKTNKKNYKKKHYTYRRYYTKCAIKN